MKMRMRMLLLVLVIFVVTGCGGSVISKTAFKDNYTQLDWYAVMQKTPKNLHWWGNCFDISEEELRIAINQIYEECIEREFVGMPSEITARDEARFQKSIDNCAIMKYISKYKDRFTCDKIPQYIKECKKVQQAISMQK